MFKLNIKNKLKEKRWTKYQLYKVIGGPDVMNYSSFNKMVNGETVQIKFKTLWLLCQALECGINDLIVEEK